MGREQGRRRCQKSRGRRAKKTTQTSRKKTGEESESGASQREEEREGRRCSNGESVTGEANRPQGCECYAEGNGSKEQRQE